MNKTLFFANLKVHRTLFVIINLVLLMYTSIMIYIFDPSGINAMIEMLQMFPEGIMKAMGFDTFATTLTTHMGSYLYGFIFIVFPMIFVTVVANSLVARHVDRGSMVYLLSTPNSRINIALTQGISLLVMLVGIFVIQSMLGILFSDLFHQGLLDVKPYLQLNLITLLVFFFVSAISFLASCVFDDSGRSLSVGVGVPILFFLFKMLYGVSEKLEFLRYLTPYTLMDMKSILETEGYVLWVSGGLLTASLILFGLAIFIFHKRSLNI